jgi:branched-chain amino acid aminotransferase
VLFVVGNKLLTPGLEEGTILAGVTRDSVLAVAREMGLEVEERPISIDELIEAYKNGELKEVFGAGTAATISQIKELRYKETDMFFDPNQGEVAKEILHRLNAIRYGQVADSHGWLLKV